MEMKDEDFITLSEHIQETIEVAYANSNERKMS